MGLAPTAAGRLTSLEAALEEREGTLASGVASFIAVDTALVADRCERITAGLVQRVAEGMLREAAAPPAGGALGDL
jgi:hypothetical protein